MALEATAQHQHQRQHQDGSDVHSSDGRDPGPTPLKTNVPTDTQTGPTGDRGCDDDKT
jgi:hypothetical protein